MTLGRLRSAYRATRFGRLFCPSRRSAAPVGIRATRTKLGFRVFWPEVAIWEASLPSLATRNGPSGTRLRRAEVCDAGSRCAYFNAYHHLCSASVSRKLCGIKAVSLGPRPSTGMVILKHQLAWVYSQHFPLVDARLCWSGGQAARFYHGHLARNPGRSRASMWIRPAKSPRASVIPPELRAPRLY